MIITGLTQGEVDSNEAKAKSAAEIAELEAYLMSTDWYATRMAEIGKAIPEEIIEKRQAARDRISALRG